MNYPKSFDGYLLSFNLKRSHETKEIKSDFVYAYTFSEVFFSL